MTAVLARREEGAVLLVVLMALALLAALAGIALRYGASGLHGLQAERAAFAREVMIPSTLAALGPLLDPADDFPRDGTPMALDLPGARVEVRVQAAEGLVNPAHARLPILQALLAAAGASPEQATRLASAISEARQARPMERPSDLAPLFLGDADLWPRVAPLITFLGSRTTVDPQTTPAALRPWMVAVVSAGVDLTQTAPSRGYFEIDLRGLAADETPDTAQSLFTHVAVLRDKAGRLHVFAQDWPQGGS